MNESKLPELFGFAAPEEMRLFWEFARGIKPDAPEDAFSETTMISLVGPFDLLSGRLDRESPNYDPCLHWRYFGDPPEFVTLLSGGTDGLHWGYVSSGELVQPLGIAGYFAHDDVTLFQEPAGLFGVIRCAAESAVEELLEYADELPEDERNRAAEGAMKCEELLDSIATFCSKTGLESPQAKKLSFVDHCNLLPDFMFSNLEKSGALPWRVECEIDRLKSQGYSGLDAQLRLGRMLWHWHHNGNPQIEELAFSLLDEVYRAQGSQFLRHVLQEHRKHRHRKSLSVFSS